jgi:hypothetical protein
LKGHAHAGNRGVLHPHKHPTKKSQLSNMPRIATFTYIHKVRTRIILGFLEKHTNISKETFTLSTYKMQVELKRKNLIVCMVFNANFLPCCNGCIIRKITNIVEIYK